MHMTRFTRFLRDKSRNENYAWKMLIGPRVSNGVPRLNRSPWNAATVAHRRRPIYYPARAHRMDFSPWHMEEARWKVWHSRRARVDVPFAAPIAGTGWHATRVPITSRFYGAHCTSYFFFQHTYVYARIPLSRITGKSFAIRNTTLQFSISIIFILIESKNKRKWYQKISGIET